MVMRRSGAPPDGGARAVGRVGALAVALGIGAAIATSPAVAWATDGADSSGAAGPGPGPTASNDAGPATSPASSAGPRHFALPRASSNRNSLRERFGNGTQSGHPEAEGAQSAVSSVVSSVTSAVAVGSQRGGGPSVPVAPPPTLTMLGLLRRPFGHSADTLAAASPLGTSQQLAAEQVATRTAATLPVALTKLVLRVGFMATADKQFSAVGGPDQANIDQLDAAVDEYAMAAAFQQQLLNSMEPAVVMQVAPPHTWYDQGVGGSRILYDNPDTVYRFMGVNGASSYVITGRFDGEMSADTSFSVLSGLNGTTTSVLTKDDLVLAPDGHSFTITVGPTPGDGQGNHLQLTDESTIIATRNTLSDWNTEVPMTLAIERVGGPPNSLFSQLGGFAIPVIGPLVVGNPILASLVSVVPPLPFDPPLLRGTFAAVIMLLGIQREATYMAVATTDPTTGKQIEPNQLKSPTRNAEFLATQLQSAGYFQLADDEALVVTIDPGGAGYFVVPVTNDWTVTNDYWNQQTSLNNSQARENPDGTYTIVISKSDPHVENWVSTGGLNQGTISMRFQDLDPAGSDPWVSSRVVKLSELDTAVPEGTPYYSGAQRANQLAARKAGYDKRFAPYPQP